jgi:hypothetical protein
MMAGVFASKKIESILESFPQPKASNLQGNLELIHRVMHRP